MTITSNHHIQSINLVVAVMLWTLKNNLNSSDSSNAMNIFYIISKSSYTTTDMTRVEHVARTRAGTNLIMFIIFWKII